MLLDIIPFSAGGRHPSINTYYISAVVCLTKHRYIIEMTSSYH